MRVIYGQFGVVKELIMEIPDKSVTCIKCSTTYNLLLAPKVMPEKLRIKEPACPQCKCRLYYS